MKLRSIFSAVLVLGFLVSTSINPASARQPETRKFYVDGKRIPAPAQVPPVYPVKEQRRGIGGTTVVAFTYGADGKVRTAEVKTSSGNNNLDSAAVAAVRQWTVNSSRDGVPTAGSSETSLTFTP